jgi:hypothetical protein
MRIIETVLLRWQVAIVLLCLTVPHFLLHGYAALWSDNEESAPAGVSDPGATSVLSTGVRSIGGARRRSAHAPGRSARVL